MLRVASLTGHVPRAVGSLAAGSFVVANAHDLHVALVPALTPTCGSGAGGAALAAGLAAVGIHLIHLLAASALLAATATRVVARVSRSRRV